MRIKGKRGIKGPRDINDLYDEIEGELDHPNRATKFFTAFQDKYKLVQLKYTDGTGKHVKKLDIPIGKLKSLTCFWKPDPVQPKLAIKKTATTKIKPKPGKPALRSARNLSKNANPVKKETTKKTNK